MDDFWFTFGLLQFPLFSGFGNGLDDTADNAYKKHHF